MAENLNYDAGESLQCYDVYCSASSKCYGNLPAYCETYGRLYNYETAMNVCPSGWHLPSKEEWDELMSFAGGQTAARKLKAATNWSNNGNGEDEFGFSALPGGFGFYFGGIAGKFDKSCQFNNGNNGGIWWSSTKGGPKDLLVYAPGGVLVYATSLDGGVGGLGSGNYFSVISLFSVRCVKD